MKSIAVAMLALSLFSACASGPEATSLEGHIAELVDEIPRSESAGRRAFVRLEALGEPAVPYLVAHLDDIRPLVAPKISLKNNASTAFEEERHYSPNTVHDALSAILNQITGQNFIFVYNGATPQEREENRRRWITWCRSTYPDDAETCGSAIGWGELANPNRPRR
ncbi:hypothetical protein LJR125_001476 [Pseudoxanthomonas sp. LjRoot125]|uniref:hypothetical protein n=1 Tax=Pseudoxanthomonas sp. LjRoot125 TaxID=3342258 RepID=UPI003E11A28B